MEFNREYGIATTIVFPMLVNGETNFAATGDWTPATGDTKISKDAGNVANTTNNPAAVGGTGSVLWSLALTAAEMQASEITIQIVDSATKAVEDQCIKISTHLGGQVSANKGIRVLEVDNATFTATTGAAEFLALGPNDTEDTDADIFIGRLLLWTSGDAIFEMTTITDSELANSKIKLTYDTIINTPTDNATAVVL